jgi:cyclophilin family peptidyl-prolyl cis-trans isomerase
MDPGATMNASVWALALCLTLPLAAQGRVRPKAATSAPAAVAPAPVPAPAPVAVKPAAPKPRVRIDTSYGPLVVELEADLAPKTVANFLQYVKEGFFAGTIFHRVIEGFMIQGGGLLADLTEKPTRPAIPNEAPETFKAGLKNTRGTLAMARTEDPQSGAAQFYINTADNPALDHKDLGAGYGYCVFGRVVEGMEAVDKIAKVKTVWRKGMQNVPEYAVRLKGAERLPEP